MPLSVGLRGAATLDFVALDWSDGVYQTELALKAGQQHPIRETQRQLASCPVLFAWDGAQFTFVSDVLGVGGIGFAVGPGQYAPSRPWEYFKLPSGLVQPRDGRLQFKLTEPMEEVAYVDDVRLHVYDLPPGIEMTLDERMGTGLPQPSGAPVFFADRVPLADAWTLRGSEHAALISMGRPCRRSWSAGSTLSGSAGGAHGTGDRVERAP